MNVTRTLSIICVVCLVVVVLPDNLRAQGRGQPPATARAAAPVDLTGYWVSVVSEDWRWRMVTPAKGDFASIPFNAEGRKLGEAWDPAKDEGAGEACKAYGAGGIMIPRQRGFPRSSKSAQKTYRN